MSKCRQYIGRVYNCTIDNYNDRPDSSAAEPFLFRATLDYNRRRPVVDPGRDYRTFVREYSNIRATGFSARVRLNATMRLARISRGHGERSHVLFLFFCEEARSSVIPSIVGSELITTRLGRDWVLNLSLISFRKSIYIIGFYIYISFCIFINSL